MAQRLSSRVGPVVPAAAEVRNTEAEDPPNVHERSVILPLVERGKCTPGELFELVDIRIGNEPGSVERGRGASQQLASSVRGGAGPDGGTIRDLRRSRAVIGGDGRCKIEL